MNSDSATDDVTSNHVDSLQQSQDSSSSALTEDTLLLPGPPRLDSPAPPDMGQSDGQQPEVRPIRGRNKMWCSGSF